MPPALVIDASALVKSALADQLGDLRRFTVHAPTLLWSETAAALRQLHFRSEISAEQAHSALDRILGHPIQSWPSQDVIVRAIVIAEHLGWAKTYDAEYLALAEQLTARLLTDDAGIRAATLTGVQVVGPRELLGP